MTQCVIVMLQECARNPQVGAKGQNSFQFLWYETHVGILTNDSQALSVSGRVICTEQ